MKPTVLVACILCIPAIQVHADDVAIDGLGGLMMMAPAIAGLAQYLPGLHKVPSFFRNLRMPGEDVEEESATPDWEKKKTSRRGFSPRPEYPTVDLDVPEISGKADEFDSSAFDKSDSKSETLSWPIDSEGADRDVT